MENEKVYEKKTTEYSMRKYIQEGEVNLIVGSLGYKIKLP